MGMKQVQEVSPGASAKAQARIDQLGSSGPNILPSLLQCDFSNLEKEVRRLEEAGFRGLHLDVMDGHFVPNLTYGMPIVAAIRRITELPLDVHVMISDPSKYARAFAEAGADIVTFHVEAVPDPQDVICRIKELGIGAGIALNPSTPLGAVEPFVGECDLALIMSVPAGFGGQAFDTTALERIKNLRTAHPHLLLEVDGGVNEETIGNCVQAGADLLVVGSAIFRHRDYGDAMDLLRRSMQCPSSS